MGKVGRQFGAVRSFRNPRSSYLVVLFPWSTDFTWQGKSWFTALPYHPCFSCKKKEMKSGGSEAYFKVGFTNFSSIDILEVMILYC